MRKESILGMGDSNPKGLELKNEGKLGNNLGVKEGGSEDKGKEGRGGKRLAFPNLIVPFSMTLHKPLLMPSIGSLPTPISSC